MAFITSGKILKRSSYARWKESERGRRGNRGQKSQIAIANVLMVRISA